MDELTITFLGSAGLGFLLVLAGLFLGGGDGGVDGADGDFNGDGGGVDVGEGLSLLSLAGMGSLLVGFGLFGFGGHRLGLGGLISLPMGLVGALATFKVTARFKRWLVRTLDTGSSTGEQDLIYQPATVTVAIPPKGKGRGQVAVKRGDRTFYLTARNEGDFELDEGQPVVITEGHEGVYTVEPYKAQH